MNRSNDAARRARRMGFSCATAALFASCATAEPSPPPAEVTDGIEVRVLLYSGRPDPAFVLEEEGDLAELRDALGAARENPEFQGATVLPSRLGYKGFVLLNPGAEVGLPEQIAVYRGDIELAGDPPRFLDDGGFLEQWLVIQALESKAISEHEVEFIRQR